MSTFVKTLHRAKTATIPAHTTPSVISKNNVIVKSQRRTYIIKHCGILTESKNHIIIIKKESKQSINHRQKKNTQSFS